MRHQRAEQFAQRRAAATHWRNYEIKNQTTSILIAGGPGRISVHMPFHILISRRKHAAVERSGARITRACARVLHSVRLNFALLRVAFRVADVQQCTAAANLMRDGSVLCPSRGNNAGVPELSRLFLLASSMTCLCERSS